MARNSAEMTTETEGRRQTQRVVERQITSRLPRQPYGAELRRAGRAARRFPGSRLITCYRHDDGDGLATIIAYNALFSLLPLLLILFTLLSLVVHSSTVHGQVISWVQSGLPDTAADPAVDMVENGRDNLGELGLITVLGLLLGGSRLFGALDRAFSTIYRLPRRPYVERKLLALAMVPVFTLLMIAAALAATLATVAMTIPDRLFDTAQRHWLTGGVTLVVAYAVAYAMSWLIYTVVPRHHSGPLTAWPGAALAAFMLVALNQLFPLYVRLMHGASAFGGAFALVLVLMLWLYLLGQILVVGAEVNALVSGRKDPTAA